MKRILWIVAFLFMGGVPERAPAQSEPPLRVRTAVEQDTALVRILDRRTHEPIRFGTAYIIKDDGKVLFLATAQHVLKGAADNPNQSIELQFFGQDLWVSASKATPMQPPELDLAMIEVPRRFASFGTSRRGAALSVNPAVEPGTIAWVYGHDPSFERAVWRECWIKARRGVVIPFDGGGVVGGFSGGVLVSSLGPVAMVTERGPNSTQNQAISYLDIADTLSQAGIEHALIRNPANDALDHAAKTGLTIAFYAEFFYPNGVYRYWSAAEMSSAEAGAYSGTVYNGHAPGEPNTVTLTPTATTVEAVFSTELIWDSNGRGGFPTKTLVFTPTSTPVIEDMVLLKSESEGVVCYLAIPTGSREFLMARTIIEHVKPGQSFASLPRGIELTDKKDLSKANREIPFVNTIEDQGVNAQREFSLPQRLVRHQPITVTGVHLVPDAWRRNQKHIEKEQTLSGTRVLVETLAQRLLDETTLGHDEQAFVLRVLEVPDENLVIRFQNASPVLRNGAYSMIADVLVDYDALRSPNR